MDAPQLDILIYAHDGRGLGHAARSAAVGMALRRLCPGLRVLLVTGARQMEFLAAGSGLDWVKLPAYATRVKNGKSQGADGPSGFADKDLGVLRGQIIQDLVVRLAPRLILVDHQPQGKHKELLPAMDTREGRRARWVLGVRGVVGDVQKVWSQVALDAFEKRFDHILWYGDSTVLGTGGLEKLEQAFGKKPRECGYVSRLAEWAALENPDPRQGRKELAGVVSIPWRGPETGKLLSGLADAIHTMDPDHGTWKVYVDRPEAARDLADLPHCEIQKTGPQYLFDLAGAKTAVVFGGYNSLADVMACRTPALVVLRGMADDEQQEHAEKLSAASGGSMIFLEEAGAEGGVVASALEKLLAAQGNSGARPNLEGAQNAARALNDILDQEPGRGRGASDQLYEVQNARQYPGQPRRRWFCGRDLDLLSWHGQDGEMLAFELCFQDGATKKVLAWSERYGFSHDAVDEGHGLCAPVFAPDGVLDATALADEFSRKSQKLPQEIQRPVLEKIRKSATGKIYARSQGWQGLK